MPKKPVRDTKKAEFKKTQDDTKELRVDHGNAPLVMVKYLEAIYKELRKINNG